MQIFPSDCVNYAMSRFNTRNLDRLGNQVRVTMKADEDGYFGRECPIQECLGYFKVTP